MISPIKIYQERGFNENYCYKIFAKITIKNYFCLPRRNPPRMQKFPYLQNWIISKVKDFALTKNAKPHIFAIHKNYFVFHHRERISLQDDKKMVKIPSLILSMYRIKRGPLNRQDHHTTFHPLNVYTGQNQRWHVVSIKTSQMRIICTLIWRESCLLVYIFTSAFILGWWIFVDMYFHKYWQSSNVQKKPPQGILRWPLPSETGTYYTHLAWFW
jgi:hypothetical protein